MGRPTPKNSKISNRQSLNKVSTYRQFDQSETIAIIKIGKNVGTSPFFRQFQTNICIILSVNECRMQNKNKIQKLALRKNKLGSEKFSWLLRSRLWLLLPHFANIYGHFIQS